MNLKSVISIFTILVILTAKSFAQNPIVPPGVYNSDPSAHVWKDGKLYVYGSRDESPKYYCSWNYDVLSTTDLKTWTITPNTFASKGPGDQIAYSDNLLFAPDCMYKNGTYYLYYCTAGSERIEGVATSKSPIGPFVNGTYMNMYGNESIDPCVFMDDDGKAYYIWGQFHAKVARLKPDMMSIDSSTIKDNVVTQKEHFFHEGGYMIKHNGIYYFVYAHMGRAGRPTCIGYSMGKSPFGPFKYGGVIIDNDHCDPNVWNNHGSLVEFNHKWYVFYHRSTNGCNSMRKSCVEPITFNKDGTIPEVEMTSQGAGDPFDATKNIDAERACLLYGNVRIQQIASDNEQLGDIWDKDAACYKYINFGSGIDSITIRVAPGKYPGKIDISDSDVWGPSVGSVDVPGNGDGKTWITLIAKIDKIAGVHPLWFRFSGGGNDLFSIDCFKFSR